MPDAAAPAAPATRKNLLLPDSERWPLDPERPVIELDEVSVAFGEKYVLRGLTLKILPGKLVVVWVFGHLKRAIRADGM